jgi:hypothetical protein
MNFADAARLLDDGLSEFWEDAIWKAGGVGEGVPCKVKRSDRDVDQGFGQERVILKAVQIKVRRSENLAPAGGDVVEIPAKGLTFTLLEDAQPMLNKYGTHWTCEAK